MSSDIERLRQAAARDPAALIRLADTLVAAGRADEAVQACRRGILQRPDDVAMRLALGRALSAAGQLEEAQAVLLDAVARQGKGAPVAAPAPRAPSPSPRRAAPEPEPEPATRDWGGGGPPLPDPGSQPLDRYADEAPTRAGRRVAGRGPDDEPRGPVDLDRVARLLLGGTGEEEDWPFEVPRPPVSEAERAWQRKRARAFIWLWALLVIVTAGIIAGSIYRAKRRDKLLAITVAHADARMREATFDGDLQAQHAYTSAMRVEPKARKYFAMVALADARLNADDGADTDAAGWAMLRRAEREQKRHPEPDPRADREERQARALLALARGEACTPLDDTQDGDIAARCAAQRGDMAGARRILETTLKQGTDRDHLRELLALGSLALGSGDLDAAEQAWNRVLAVNPQHPRAMVSRALAALERGENPPIAAPAGELGPTTSAWYHLALGLSALRHSKSAADDARASQELDLAEKGIIHDGRLALLYGRARLMEGQVAEAEQAMRIAERLDPNDGDVSVLDAEVALAKGFEEKVAAALAPHGPADSVTPRRLAVYGRALCLTGRYREAVAALDAALARRPGDATAITYRAIANAHLGDMKGALRELERAAAQLGSTAPYYGLGLLAYERHDLLKAEGELKKALAHNSESFRARALLGRVLRDLGQPKEALAELEQAERDAPALVQVHSALGRIYLDLGRDREARAELRKVLDAGKATADDKLGYARASIRLGFVDDGAQALEDAVNAGALAPQVARLKLELQSWKGPKEALASARALEKLRKGPGARDADLAVAAANAWRRAGDYKRASDDFGAALFGDALHANLGLGQVQLLSNDPVSAETSFRAALEAWGRGPYGVDDQTAARVGLARARLARKDPAGALAALAPCATDDPTAPEPHLWLARAYLQEGARDKAIAQAEKATELDDQYADAFLLLGDLLTGKVGRGAVGASNREQARKAYRRFLELEPNSPHARTVRHALATLR